LGDNSMRVDSRLWLSGNISYRITVLAIQNRLFG
jgi:hypothetical protein